MSDGLRFGGHPRHHSMSDYWQSRYLLDRISWPGVGDESKCRYPWSVQVGVVVIPSRIRRTRRVGFFAGRINL